MAKVRIDVAVDKPSCGSSWLHQADLIRGKAVLVYWKEENDQFTVIELEADDPAIASLTPTSMKASAVGE